MLFHRPLTRLVVALGVSSGCASIMPACGLFPSLDELGGGADAAVSGEAGMDVTSDEPEASATTDSGDASAACPGTAPPAMIRVGSFCIDSTEVTNAQYQAFLRSVGSGAIVQPAICSWNTTLIPGKTPGATWSFTPGTEDYPVAAVNWCQSFAYCMWAGKRLCGRIGGGPNPFFESHNAAASQWLAACSREGALAYPYGNAYDAAACVTGTSHTRATRVGELVTCQGGFDGIFDMSGNVLEWEDSCSGDGPTDGCQVRGGNFAASEQTARCDYDQLPQSRQNNAEDIGFRCCAP